MKLAVIIPTLNEERTIGSCLEAVGAHSDLDVVVVDGGSTDATCQRAAEAGARVVEGKPGRGSQLNLGAASTSAPDLLFVHSDCRLPPGWRPVLERALQDRRTSLACFRLRTETGDATEGTVLTRMWLWTLDLRSRGWRLPYGDQGFAVRREIFDAVGGFPDIPLMEDLVFAGRCRRQGAIRRIPLLMRTTARRYRRFPIRTRVMNLVFPVLFRCGVSPHQLARWYREVR